MKIYVDNEVMELHELLKSERTRKGISQNDVVMGLMDMGIDVSSATISRVENGWEPTWSVVNGYCKILGWSLSDLDKKLKQSESNVGSVNEDSVHYDATSKRTISKAVGRNIPICSWVNAGLWGDSPCIADYEQEKRFVPGKLPKNTFGLKVTGTSMENPNGKHNFPDGSIILINPDAQYEVNDFVVVWDEDTQLATFKQLIDNCGEKLLKPLNPQYPVMHVTESSIVKGVVFRVIDDRKV
ncbi:MAG: helix-turn-helix domain-containing protein [Vibrio sp.]